MKMREVIVENADTQTLATALEFLRNRFHNKKLKPTISMNSLVNTVKNISGNDAFSATDIRFLAGSDPTIQSLVKNIDDATGQVDLKPFGDEVDGDPADSPEPLDADVKNAQKTVQSMAKRAAEKRT
jgi:hypothetical protein